MYLRLLNDQNRRIMKENFQIHIWLGLLLCLLGMSCSDDTPAKGDDPGMVTRSWKSMSG